MFAMVPVGEEAASEKNTFVLRLHVKCFRDGTQMVNDRGQHMSLILCICKPSQIFFGILS